MKTRDSKRFQIFAHIVLILCAVAALFPFLLLIVSSLTNEADIIRNGYSLFPKKLSLAAYEYIWGQKSQIFRAYAVTMTVTIAGTIVGVLMTVLYAYGISRKDLPGRKFLSFFLFFTMLFNGGLVPTYLMYTEYFHMKNTLAALIVPNLLFNAFNVILVRTYLQGNIPDALIESARIDGASETTIMWKIVMPLAKPIIATISLFVAVAYWNDWMNGLYYISKPELYSIQSLLNNMMKNIEYLSNNPTAAGNISGQIANMPRKTISMAIAVVGMLPILVVYPFIQKNFVKGIAIGAVKG
ncbi:carbohydrate ABC transporter permease [Lachnospiraceae bacterium ZAX-1]